MLNRPKPLVLLILDGFGYSLDKKIMHREWLIHLAGISSKRLSNDLIGLLRPLCWFAHEQMGNSEVGISI